MSFSIRHFLNVISRLELFPISRATWARSISLLALISSLWWNSFLQMLYSMRSNTLIELMTHIMFYFFPRIMSRKPFIFLSNFSFQLSLWFSACSCEQVHNQKVQSYICGASSKALRTLFLVNKWDNIDASCHLHQDIWHFKLLIPIQIDHTDHQTHRQSCHP